ncbi:MAG: hypothetical protein H7070_08285 [Saprospiraceae bacterium]|nr:hypothetical protein [Pyrinomonadaceae bacterium]
MLRTEIRRRRVNKLFATADRLADLDEPMTDAEVEAESRLLVGSVANNDADFSR